MLALGPAMVHENALVRDVEAAHFAASSGLGESERDDLGHGRMLLLLHHVQLLLAGGRDFESLMTQTLKRQVERRSGPTKG